MYSKLRIYATLYIHPAKPIFQHQAVSLRLLELLYSKLVPVNSEVLRT
uniref:Uncharacterized protein n=1 Tax=Arundo donax TaxID=35708 RepID=A0A0A9C137_ARUDO